MPEVKVPNYTTVEMSIDISDYVDEIEVEIDSSIVEEALMNGEVRSSELLDMIEHDEIISFCRSEEVEFPDDYVVSLVKGRDDLVKLALSGKGTTTRDEASALLSHLLIVGRTEAREVVRGLVRHLLAHEALRLAVLDAMGQHYAGADLEPLVVEDEAAKAAK